MFIFCLKDTDNDKVGSVLSQSNIKHSIHKIDESILNTIKEDNGIKRVLIVFNQDKSSIINNITNELRKLGIQYNFINSITANNETILKKLVTNISSIKETCNSKLDALKTNNWKDDESKQIHGVEKHLGTVLKNVPMIFGRYGHNMWFDNMYNGRNAFLVLSGPSLLKIDYKKLYMPGVLTMATNNAVRTVRTNMWVSVDDPSHFIKSIWLDSKIMKFVPWTHSEKFLFDNESWSNMPVKVGDCPNVWYYKRNEHFIAEQFLYEDTFNWGNHGDLGGGRSVMLVAIRLLYILGIRNVYLVGCDFKMDQNTKYHFEQDRSSGSINGNNSTYQKLNERFTQLRPIFERHNFNIFNCNKESGLKAFPFIEFEDAIKRTAIHNTENERTEGLYDRKANGK